MYLCITGFLENDSEDSSLKYELDIVSEYENAVMTVLGGKILRTSVMGTFP